MLKKVVISGSLGKQFATIKLIKISFHNIILHCTLTTSKQSLLVGKFISKNKDLNFTKMCAYAPV